MSLANLFATPQRATSTGSASLIRLSISILWALLLNCSAQASDPMICNGHASLCKRRYDQVVYPTTHNSHAYVWGPRPTAFAPNQEVPISRQLREGIRALMIDLWYHRGVVHTCHGVCGIGHAPLTDALREISGFVRNNPTEVVTLIFESYVRAEDVAQLLDQADLLRYAWSQSPNTSWPLLSEMQASGKNLVIFTQDDHSPYSWYHPLFSHAVETHYSVRKERDFDCRFNRGNPDNSLFILNHFVTRPLFRRAWNVRPNRIESLIGHADRCFSEKGKTPNFLTVDFYRSGEVLEAARQLNLRAARGPF